MAARSRGDFAGKPCCAMGVWRGMGTPKPWHGSAELERHPVDRPRDPMPCVFVRGVFVPDTMPAEAGVSFDAVRS